MSEPIPQVTDYLQRLLHIQAELSIVSNRIAALKRERQEIESEVSGLLVWDSLYLDPALLAKGCIAEIGDSLTNEPLIYFRPFEFSSEEGRSAIEEAIAQIDS